MKQPFAPIQLEKRPCVLAVEDDEDNLLLIEYVLEKINCLFLKASDSITALSLATVHLPDLILLDIVLPQWDGFYFLQQLKQNPLTSCIPVIAVTGLVLPCIQQRLQEAGCVDYLSKPYRLPELENIILLHLHRCCLPTPPVIEI